VFDKNGKFLRQWLPQGMSTVHCMSIAMTGRSMFCNRQGSKIQIYDKMEQYEAHHRGAVDAVTPPKDGNIKQSGGSAVAARFSHDPQQKYIFMINQNNAQVEIIDRRQRQDRGATSAVRGASRASSIRRTASRSIPRTTSTSTKNRGKRSPTSQDRRSAIGRSI